MYGTVDGSDLVKQLSAHFLTVTQELVPLPLYKCILCGVTPPTNLNESFTFHSEESPLSSFYLSTSDSFGFFSGQDIVLVS